MGRCENENSSQINSKDVYYTGPYLSTLGINTNTSLNDIVTIINNYLADFNAPTNYQINGGINIQTADGLTLEFNIPHGLGQVPSSWTVNAINIDTGPIFSVTATSSILIVQYSVAPSQGVQLEFVWQASILS